MVLGTLVLLLAVAAEMLEGVFDPGPPTGTLF
jgi:hypothetical protein